MAAQRKLEHELGIPPEQILLERLNYLTRIHYLAPSDGMWGEHESKSVTLDFGHLLTINFITVDYIFFIKADVDLKINPNEVRDYKYVTPEELKAMFADSSKWKGGEHKEKFLPSVQRYSTGRTRLLPA